MSQRSYKVSYMDPFDDGLEDGDEVPFGKYRPIKYKNDPPQSRRRREDRGWDDE